jgi:hypothetical protein
LLGREPGEVEVLGRGWGRSRRSRTTWGRAKWLLRTTERVEKLRRRRGEGH